MTHQLKEMGTSNYEWKLQYLVIMTDVKFLVNIIEYSLIYSVEH